MSEYKSESCMLSFEMAEKKKQLIWKQSHRFVLNPGTATVKIFSWHFHMSGSITSFCMPTRKMALFHICTHASGFFCPRVVSEINQGES